MPLHLAQHTLVPCVNRDLCLTCSINPCSRHMILELFISPITFICIYKYFQPLIYSLSLIDGKMETVTDFIFLGSKIRTDSDCSHEIKRYLLLGRKAMTNWDSILKSRDITLLTKVSRVKAMIFPVVIWRCESWTIRRLSAKKLILSNCDAGEDSWESLGEQGDQTSQS